MIRNSFPPRNLAEDEVLRAVCAALIDDRTEEAKSIAREHVPHQPFPSRSSRTRNYSVKEQLDIFMRDGFIDRYNGGLVVLPAALRTMSILMPEEIPYHRNLKANACHRLFWDMAATIDHVKPLIYGGKDHRENLITTSVLHNMIKANWTLEQIGWEQYLPGDLLEWDGLSRWFLATYKKNPQLASIGELKHWAAAVEQAFN